MKPKKSKPLYEALTNAADLIVSSAIYQPPSTYRSVDYSDAEYISSCGEAAKLIN